jgi:hypothetical protein
MSFQPMLADKAPAVLRFPLLVSSKLDGIRCTVINGVAMSRSFKPLPNKHLQKVLAEGFDGLDGEIIVGPVGAKDVYNKTNSAVMSRTSCFTSSTTSMPVTTLRSVSAMKACSGWT